ncbi:non-canonical purine NTP pyrophosphatase, RdgB/HAM1 family [Hyphomicrobium methylovorum]|uniref:RdgB/HAM1 family non-canonical purine NTP pyrophosphatase n=1 Tax=Hyphomicrobium methylovorum TaxID=84 RepID=UPI0015E6A7B8|nr:RdgB/HAM1 family non-canonical purine NTP pyrophosphatase [Hyphomicrobium methylovorum]MBA2126243.1 non-canonical purine NTP pyrophosphatase, RdgB/HAM1 family [Hyphomicrobium methylovorum]
MAKLAAGTRLVVASHNPGKVWEIRQLLAPYGLDAISAGDLDLAEPEETATTFVGNAQLKAVAAAEGSGLPALADDSGLEVKCLDGAPGIYSARWAGPGKDFGVAMKKVADEITARNGWETPPRANFISVLCLAWPSGETRVFEGRVFGHLVWPPRGGNGFGYDPMFVADGASDTFGEMEPAAKYAISHRTRAFAQFKSEMLDQIAPNESASGASEGDRDAFFAAAASLSTRPELAAFVARLRGDLADHGRDWGNATLEDFLESLSRELSVDAKSDGPAWRQVAHALLAASAKR